MIAATAILSIGAFLIAFWRLRVAEIAAGVLVTARDALATMRDEALDDRQRERAVQQASIRLMGAFVSILLRSLLALLAALLPIWAVALTGLAPQDAVVSYLSRWDVIAVATLVILAGFVVWTRLRPAR